jgi:hypothetical protein
LFPFPKKLATHIFAFFFTLTDNARTRTRPIHLSQTPLAYTHFFFFQIKKRIFGKQNLVFCQMCDACSFPGKKNKVLKTPFVLI